MCNVCQTLHFKKDIKKFLLEQKKTYFRLVKSNCNTLSNTICRKCNNAVKKYKIPQYATLHNIRMNKPMQYVQMLTQLEEHLVSLQITFAQI